MADDDDVAQRLKGRTRSGGSGHMRPFGVHAAQGSDFGIIEIAADETQTAKVTDAAVARTGRQQKDDALKRIRGADNAVIRADGADEGAVHINMRLAFRGCGANDQGDAVPGIGTDFAITEAA